MKALIFLLHPAFVAALNIYLAGNCAVKDYNNVFKGEHKENISDALRSSFKLDDKSLLDYFESYWKARPKQIVFNGNFFHKEVQPILWYTKPILSNVIKMTTTHEFERYAYKNDVDARTNVYTALNTEVYKKISSSNAIGNFTGKEIEFEVNVNTKRLGHVFSGKFRVPWGKDFKKDYVLFVGERYPRVLWLDPGQSVLVVTQKTKHVLQFKVEYLAWLDGDVGAVYDKRPELSLEDVPELQLKNVTVTQVFEIEFYTNVKFVVVDTFALCKLGEKNYKVNFTDANWIRSTQERPAYFRSRYFAKVKETGNWQ